MAKTRPSGMKKKSAPRKALRGAALFVLSVFLVGFMTAFTVGGYFFINVIKTVGGDQVVDLAAEKNEQSQTTIIYAYDNKGRKVEYARLHGEENRIWLDITEGDPSYPDDPDRKIIAPDFRNLANAYIALEDKRFWEHHGVDWIRLAGVLKYNFSQGGSTITQQLIKNVTEENDFTAVRKYREILAALNMERYYTKVEILEAYVNTLYLGRGCYGVLTGAERYFDKNVKDLTIAECAALAAITKNPYKFDPIKDPAENRARQETCLVNMRDQGLITKEQYEQAILEAADMKFNIRPAKPSQKKDAAQAQPEQINNYYVDFIIESVIADLMETGMEKSTATKKVYSGGLKILAAVDIDIQNELEDVFRKRTTFKDMKGSAKNPINAAMTVMNYEGRVVAIVGGAGEKTQNRGLNRASQSWRQPGSTIKPLAVYGPSIEKNLIHWSTLTPNEAFYYDAIGEMWPHNVDGTYGNGRKVTTQYALAKSINTVAARTVKNRLGVKKAFAFLEDNFGFAKLDPRNDMVLPSMAVGSMFNGMSTLEECAAYAAFGSGGVYYEPFCYYSVRVIQNGKEKDLLKHEEVKRRVFSEDTAKVMNEMLQTVPLEDYVTGGNGKYIGKYKRFGKTGTTSNNNDRWFSGGTPFYVGTVWFGYDIPKDLGKITNPSAKIWMEVFNRIHKDSDLDTSKGFPKSTKAVQKSYCTRTGLLAGDSCPSATGWYRKDNLPKYCSGGHVTQTPVTPEKPTGGEEPTQDAPEETTTYWFQQFPEIISGVAEALDE